MKLKVCGMRFKDNMKAVASIDPDYLGFIFYDRSPRQFRSDFIPELPSAVKKTGVFVNADPDEIINLTDKFSLQAIQLHGEESANYCERLKARFANRDIELIKAFPVDEDFNFDILKEFEPFVDYFLFDTKGRLPGGNGYVFDWNMLAGYPSERPFFLSGGIGLEEIDELTHFTSQKVSEKCYAIDVNSRFETEPGQKNIDTLKEFKTLLRSKNIL